MALYGNDTSRAENLRKPATSSRLTVNCHVRRRAEPPPPIRRPCVTAVRREVNRDTQGHLQNTQNVTISFPACCVSHRAVTRSNPQKKPRPLSRIRAVQHNCQKCYIKENKNRIVLLAGSMCAKHAFQCFHNNELSNDQGTRSKNNKTKNMYLCNVNNKLLLLFLLGTSVRT